MVDIIKERKKFLIGLASLTIIALFVNILIKTYPDVSSWVKSYEYERYYSVALGNFVKNPGFYKIKEGGKLNQLIYKAGGFVWPYSSSNRNLIADEYSTQNIEELIIRQPHGRKPRYQ